MLTIHTNYPDLTQLLITTIHTKYHPYKLFRSHTIANHNPQPYSVSKCTIHTHSSDLMQSLITIQSLFPSYHTNCLISAILLDYHNNLVGLKHTAHTHYCLSIPTAQIYMAVRSVQTNNTLECPKRTLHTHSLVLHTVSTHTPQHTQSRDTSNSMRQSNQIHPKQLDCHKCTIPTHYSDLTWSLFTIHSPTLSLSWPSMLTIQISHNRQSQSKALLSL